MNFNEHYDLVGRHAFLSASKYSWLNYDSDKLVTAYKNYLAVNRGTELHDLASKCITLCVKLPRNHKTLNMYVNDAIGFNMKPEQVLYFSENCFGTADAISFNGGTLRIHDLKTGVTPAKMDQLVVYAALFCLEYDVRPSEIKIVLRIYQNDEYIEDVPDPELIETVIGKIIDFDRLIDRIKDEEQL